MTDPKILEVLKKYEDLLAELRPDYERVGLVDDELAHVHGMISQVRGFLLEGRREKAFRWLGFMQGVFYAKGLYTIEEMADHNRPEVPDA